MVFVAKQLRYNIPEPLADHMARTWRAGVAHEKPVYILEYLPEIDRVISKRLPGDMFVGNLTAGMENRR